MAAATQRHTLVYSAQCLNCARFMESLARTGVANQVTLLEVGSLAPGQRASITAVPALVLADGATLYGTKAFEWLKQFEGDMELGGFDGGHGALAFSDLEGSSYASYCQGYGPFEPVA